MSKWYACDSCGQITEVPNPNGEVPACGGPIGKTCDRYEQPMREMSPEEARDLQA